MTCVRGAERRGVRGLVTALGGGTLVSVVRSGVEECQSQSGNHPVAKAPQHESGDESPQSKVHRFGGRDTCVRGAERHSTFNIQGSSVENFTRSAPQVPLASKP